jgi:predicted amino acid dehydrogenase
MVHKQPVKAVIALACFLEKAGAKIVGLGAYTSIVGEGGVKVASAVDVSVTTGNSYTAYTGVQAALAAASRMGHDPKRCKAAVIGASGSIGLAVTRLLRDQLQEKVLVVGSSFSRMVAALDSVGLYDGGGVKVSELQEAILQADIILTVTSAVGELAINPQWFKPGAVVCDIARPRDIGEQVARARPDVLVIDGGVIQVPGCSEDLGVGFPPGLTYACMAETIILALEGLTDEDFSVGREIEMGQVELIAHLAEKHDFRPAGWRSFDRLLMDEQIEQIRQSAIGRGAKLT